MSVDFVPNYSEEMSMIAVEICFRISVIENMVHNIMENLAKIRSIFLNDLKMTRNLSQILECLLQTRGAVNHKFREARPWRGLVHSGGDNNQVSAKFESSLTVRGVQGMMTMSAAGESTGEGGDTLLYVVDISDALCYTLDETIADDFGVVYPPSHQVKEPFPTAAGDDARDNSAARPAPLSPEEYKEEEEEEEEVDFANNEGLKVAELEEEIKVECSEDVDPDAKFYDDWVPDQDLFKEDSDIDDDIDIIPRKSKKPKLNKAENFQTYKCDKCGAAFEKEKYLKQHENLFEHDKYKCDKCDQSFSWKNAYDKHIECHKTDVKCKQESSETDVKHLDVKDPGSNLVSHSSLAGNGGEVKEEDDKFVVDTFSELMTEIEGGVINDSTANEDEDGEKSGGHKGRYNPMVQCNICGKVMLKSSSFQHKKTHTGERPHACEVCGKTFLRQNNLRTHMKVHSDREKTYCQTCGKGFFNKVSMTKHLLNGACDKSQMPGLSNVDPATVFKLRPPSLKKRKRYPKNDPLVECEVCGKMRRKSNIHNHLKIHTGEKPYSCTECDKSFISKYNLKQHVNINHTNQRERMLCQICGAGFLHKQSLMNHSCEKHKSKQENLSCKVCGKVVKTDCHLKSHMKIHSEERPYTCEVCGESFRRPYEINIHKQRYHDKPTCDICATSFTAISALNRHIQSVHSDKRPYACDVCGKSYKDKFSMTKHKVIHNKDEHVKCKCEVCPKSFFFLSDLKKHYQKVHKLDLTVD